LKKKRVLLPIKRGVYTFVPFGSIATGSRISEFLIPSVLLPDSPYYIGYSTMYNYYSFSEQIFQTIYVLNTRFSRKKVICGIVFKFVKVPLNRFYGLETVQVDKQPAVISSRERTLVDLVYFSDPVGGVAPALDILKDVVKGRRCDIGKLVDMAARFPSVTTRKRIGVALQAAGVNKNLLKPLIQSVATTAVSSLGTSRKGRIDKTWRAIINDPQ
jgi:predicted transcriptional regulator of viral defense system